MSRRSARTAVVQHHEEMEVDDEEEEDSDEDNDGEQDSEEDENDDSDENDGDDDDDKGSSSRGSREQTPSDRDGEESGRRGRGRYSSPASSSAVKKSSRASKESDTSRALTGVVLSMEEMIQNTVLYLLLLHHKKTPIKRADIVKHALNGQIKSYPEVMDKIKDILLEKFGVELVGVEETKGKTTGFVSYILVTKFPMFTTECGNVTRTDDAIAKRSFLYLILVTIFMYNRFIEEDMVWKIYEAMFSNTGMCKKKDNLRGILRMEYVSTLYLKVEEQKETEQISCRYGWGLRAEKEYSKYAMLKFVCQKYGDKKPYEYTVQYGKVIEAEKEAVEADNNGINDTDNAMDDEESQTVVFADGGTVDRVELRGGGAPSPRTEGSVNGSSDANGRANSESEREKSGNEDERESGSDEGSISGSDAAQDRSDAGSVSSSGSGSSSESEG